MTGRPSATRTIAAGVVGNMLEWYDFAIYGYFAVQIGRTFFPSSDPVSQVLSAFGVFAVVFADPDSAAVFLVVEAGVVENFLDLSQA